MEKKNAILEMQLQLKEFDVRHLKSWFGVLALILMASSSTWAQDPGWPRKLVKPGGTSPKALKPFGERFGLLGRDSLNDWEVRGNVKIDG